MGRILLVDDDALVARQGASVLARYAPTEVVHRTVDALERLRSNAGWHAVFVDLDLQDRSQAVPTPDHAGLAIATVARLLLPRALVAVITGIEDEECRVLARGLRIDYELKPADLAALAERSLRDGDIGDPALPDAAAQRLARETLLAEAMQAVASTRLSPAEAGVLTAQVDHCERSGTTFPAEQARDRLGISASTYKKHVARVLRKTHADSLEQLLARLQWRSRLALAARCRRQV